MNPPDSKPTNLPQQLHGDASGRRAGTDPGGAPKAAVAVHATEKPKPKTLQDEIYEILYGKTKNLVERLKPLQMPQAIIEKATRSLATRASRKLLAEAIKYARNSASAMKFDDTDLLNEILAQRDFAQIKVHPPASEKASAGDRSKGGKDAR